MSNYMSKDAVILSNIPCSIPWIPVLRRLGYMRSAEPDSQTKKRIEKVMTDAATIADPRGIYRILPCKAVENTIVIQERFVIQSKAVYRLFESCSHCAVMAVTVGPAICRERDSLMNDKGKYADGVILDAVASELADAAMAWIYDLTAKIGRGQGFSATMRYSPGYKDLYLSTQSMIDELLDLSRIGICVTDSFMLEPEKSVTALAGWEK
ncbi:MAG: vitamin B12 dependent-methionine synthase activation domain-containing protein [Candidatus Auribacterota bacterium]|nr:vitamin B12 dependent-methionine synthase activation domain-containing protein [Candidatus Auribacterota bacterium]